MSGSSDARNFDDFPAVSFLQCFDAVKNDWWGAGVVICLEQGADLHMAQLMPLPLTVSCFSKIQIDFTFLVLAHPEKGPSNGCVCACSKSRNFTN